MEFRGLFIFLCAFVVATTVSAQGSVVEVQRSFEFEDALSDSQQTMWQWRSEASGKKTLRLEDYSESYHIDFTVCIVPNDPTKNVSLAIDDIRYSNDGPPDNIYVRINGIVHDYFQTHEKWRSGHEWNVFRNSGRLGDRISLPEGQYTITVSAVTDLYGVELDRIRLNADNQNPSSDLFCAASVSFYTFK